MCNFCSNTLSNNTLTYRNHVYNFCNDCYPKAKLCDHCMCLGVYELNIHYTDAQGFTCTACAGGTKECKKCGVNHIGEGELCRKCAKKWFICKDCGKTKTKTRSLITQYEFLEREYVLPERNICSKCYKDNYTAYPAKTVKYCTACHKLHTSNDKWCPTCIENSFICDSCGKQHLKSFVKEVKGKLWCVGCVEAKLKVCADCHTYHFKNEGHLLTNGFICNTCFKAGQECSICGRFSSDNTQIDGYTLCSNCNCRVTVCVICNKAHYDIIQGACPDCRFELGIDYIRNYSTKMPIKLKGKVTQPHYGIENEVSVKPSLSVDYGLRFFASKYKGKDVIYKKDASIDHGFECVFRPFTFTEVQNLTFNWDDRLFRPHSSCGMHIHINKSAFTTYHLYKFTKFFQQFEEYVFKIAERAPNHYCYTHYGDAKVLAKNRTSSIRGALNFKNKSTVEVRIFAGVVTESQFKKNVEFIDALYYFTKNNKTSDAIDKVKFEKWVFTQKYPNLKRFLKEI